MNTKTSHSLASSYPQYIERGSEQAVEQPYALQDTRLFGFVLKSDLESLQALCNKYLNQPTNGQVEYRPVAPYIILTFDSIGDIHSTKEPDRERGSFSEAGEVVFWILTRSSQGLAWFIPYIFVNSSSALVSGREVYGFPKEWAWFRIPPDPRNPQIFSLETVATKTFSPRSRATRQQLLTIQPIQEDNKSESSWLNEEPINVLEEILESVIPELPDLIKKEMSVVFLKQFRDIKDGTKACYQAIVEAKVKLDKLYGFHPLGHKFQVNIQDFASHPIISELGLKPEQTATLAFWSNFDFTLEDGTEIWKA